jgi:hypothetical protein
MPEFTEEEYNSYYENKKRALESILGEMYPLVFHAIIPFFIGGPVDIYCFSNAMPGTALVTMELIQPDGSGPMPNDIGTYELIAFTKHDVSTSSCEKAKPVDPDGCQFDKINQQITSIFTTIANYSFEGVLNPKDTCELPQDGGKNICVVFDEYQKPENPFVIDGRRHCLLLCIEVFRSELEYAIEKGSDKLFKKLKKHGYYPYSDLDREPVA